MQHVDGAYLRISEDPNDTRRGVDRQREDAIAMCAQIGGDPERMAYYPENDTSAYKKKRIKVADPMGNVYDGWRVIRPYWHRALQDLRTGKITRLIVWDLDRLARDPRDLEDAIEVVEHYGATIVSATSAEIDLTTEGGRMMARVFVLMANKASADTARRVKRAHLATAREGRPVGGYRPFGWLDDKATLHPEESLVARRMVTDLLAGKSVRSVVHWLSEEGWSTTTGKPWQPQTVRQYLRNPRLAGYRTYRGEILLDDDGRPVAGLWEALLDREEWDRVMLLLSRPDPRERKPRRGDPHYLLTGILRCGVCSGPMFGNGRTVGGERTHYYACRVAEGRGRHTNSVSSRVDEMVSELVRRSIAEERLDVAPAGAWPGEADLARVEAKIVELMAAYSDDLLGSEVVFPRVRALERERDEKRENRAQWLAETTGPVVSSLTPEVWGELDTDQRREVIGARLDAVLVKPPTAHSNRFDPRRVEPVWKRRD